MSPAEQICLIIGRIYREGNTSLTGGNLSIMTPEGDMWITPTSVDKGSLKPDDIMLVKADGSIVGKHRPSSEYPFHRNLYKIHPELHSVIHAHPPGLVTFSIAHEVPDTRISADLYRICGEVGFAPYDVPGSEGLGRNIADTFASNMAYKAVVMENHGVVLMGEDLGEAYARFEALELCCNIILSAKALGTPKYLSEIPEASKAIVSSSKRVNCLKRREICEKLHRACEQRLMCASTGSIALRRKGGEFLVNADDVQRWDADERDIVALSLSEGTEAPIQRAIFNRNPEVGAIIFAQPQYLMGFNLSAAPYDVRTIPESWIYLQDVPRLSRESAPEDIAEAISRNSVVMLENSCIIATAPTLLAAFDHLEVAEFTAKSLLLSRDLGPVHPITDAQVEELRIAFNVK